MFLSCVCFVVICACSYECYWYSMGCGWIQGDFIFIFICYEHSKEKSRFLGNLVLWVISSLHNLVLLVIVWPTLFPWSTLNVKLESMSITIMSKGGKLKPNTSLELYFVNKRNVCAPRPLDVHPSLEARFMTLIAPSLLNKCLIWGLALDSHDHC